MNCLFHTRSKFRGTNDEQCGSPRPLLDSSFVLQNCSQLKYCNEMKLQVKTLSCPTLAVTVDENATVLSLMETIKVNSFFFSPSVDCKKRKSGEFLLINKGLYVVPSC